ncbi:hypothetical protein Tco_1069848 [Tanacetum coccineum]|uniref:Uncharacterized protein n=1 Tax=Tanacetum coccineum TaxID=301880 RepID=A0ABQ5HJT6_9ASTR
MHETGQNQRRNFSLGVKESRGPGSAGAWVREVGEEQDGDTRGRGSDSDQGEVSSGSDKRWWARPSSGNKGGSQARQYRFSFPGGVMCEVELREEVEASEVEEARDSVFPRVSIDAGWPGQRRSEVLSGATRGRACCEGAAGWGRSGAPGERWAVRLEGGMRGRRGTYSGTRQRAGGEGTVVKGEEPEGNKRAVAGGWTRRDGVMRSIGRRSDRREVTRPLTPVTP